MKDRFKKLNIVFDENGNTVISKEKLTQLFDQAQLGEIYFDESRPSDEGYLLIDKNGRDFYPFPSDEIEEWEHDGSTKPGDMLYKFMYIKTY